MATKLARPLPPDIERIYDSDRGTVLSAYGDWAFHHNDAEALIDAHPPSFSTLAAAHAFDFPGRSLSLWTAIRRVSWNTFCLVTTTIALSPAATAGAADVPRVTHICLRPVGSAGTPSAQHTSVYV
jgi:hypothetical protein